MSEAVMICKEGYKHIQIKNTLLKGFEIGS